MTIKIGNIKLSNSKWIYVILILVYKIALDIVFVDIFRQYILIT